MANRMLAFLDDGLSDAHSLAFDASAVPVTPAGIRNGERRVLLGLALF